MPSCSQNLLYLRIENFDLNSTALETASCHLATAPHAASEELCRLDVPATICCCACTTSTAPADALQQPTETA
jgi:hypothetical protein